MATRYLRQTTTGHLYVRTPELEVRDDMEPYEPPPVPETSKDAEKPPAPRKAQP